MVQGQASGVRVDMPCSGACVGALPVSLAWLAAITGWQCYFPMAYGYHMIGTSFSNHGPGGQCMSTSLVCEK